ncbi:hypothetical protein KSS87_010967 [Heliosperma pusillum]|nr:hypothetical protein KSS87_010967 [Heliosperma pusillum]
MKSASAAISFMVQKQLLKAIKKQKEDVARKKAEKEAKEKTRNEAKNKTKGGGGNNDGKDKGKGKMDGSSTGVCICLRSAAKITHRAQAITALASKWHVCATIDVFEDAADGEPHVIHSLSPQISSQVFPYSASSESDDEDGDGEDNLDNAKMVPAIANTISYQRRQALVTYLENNRAGITVFGFMLDRTYLHTIFGVELSLVLWLLSKTVGIS